jgi:uncharacterized protein (TIGR00369 family)
VHDDQVMAAFRSVPVNRWLGFRLLEHGPESARAAMPPRPEHLQETGVIQGGILTALADTTAVYALWPQLPPGTRMTSIELKLNFLRPALAGRGELTAGARVVQRGRKVGVCEVQVEQEGRPVALGLFTYLFWRDDE